MKRLFLCLMMLCLVGKVLLAQNINAAEYFIDTDPGVGLGTTIPVLTPSDTINKDIAIPLNNLNIGFHQLFIRTQNVNGKWSLAEGRMFMVIPAAASSNQTISAAEYFIDADPGVGLGTAISIATPGDTITKNVAILLNNLSIGFHQLFIRTQYDNGQWSLTEGRMFMVIPAATSSNQTISAAEYFIDADPGVGLGTAISIAAPGDTITKNVAILLNNLSIGFHQLFIRTQYDNGQWSLTEGRMFMVIPAATSSNQTISAAEYFFDTDPGLGAGIAIPITAPSDSISTYVGLNLNNLSTGQHQLFIRVQYDNGQWSLIEGRSVIVLPASTSSTQTISAAEYFIDTDPGLGLGTAVPIATPSDTINKNVAIVLNNLSIGFHQIFLRVQYGTGQWSLGEGRMFMVIPASASATQTISAAEYFFDADPGLGQGTAISITTPSDSISKNVAILLNNINPGFHQLFLRVQYGNGQWSLIDGRMFYVTPAITSTGIAGINKAEYFFDTDPGVGNGIDLALSNTGDSVFVNQPMLPLPSTLTSSSHKISIRVRLDNGQWSLFESKTFTLTGGQIAPASITASELAVTCTNKDITLTAAGGNAYLWDNGSTDPVRKVSTANTYFVTVTSVSGSTAMAYIEIGEDKVLPTVAFTHSNDTLTCTIPSDTIRVIGKPSYNYVWQNGSTGTQYVSTLGNYSEVKVTDNTNGCSATYNTRTYLNNSIAVTINPTPFHALSCKIDTLKLNVTANLLKGNTTFLWSSNNTGNNIKVTKTGPYAVTVTGSNGCVTTQSFNVFKDLSAPSVYAWGSKPICTGSSTTLSAGGGVSYLWSNGATTASTSVTPTSTTNYTVTATNAGGCTAKASQLVEVYQHTPLGNFANMQPKDSAFNVPLNNATFSWQPVSLANNYELHTWKAGTSVVTTQNVGEGINTQLNNLAPFQHYKWTLKASNPCISKFSDTLTYKTRGLSDLVIDSVFMPASINSGSVITIKFWVKNIGNASTGSTSWKDWIWLSIDNELGGWGDVQLIELGNLSYLAPGESYMQTAKITLHPSYIGSFHVFITSDTRNASCQTFPCTNTTPRTCHSVQIAELEENNNFAIKSLNLLPSPTPNLKVVDLAVNPSTVNGGKNINVKYKIKNAGDADFVKELSLAYFNVTSSLGGSYSRYNNPYRDSIFISKDNIFNRSTAVFLGRNSKIYYDEVRVNMGNSGSALSPIITGTGNSFALKKDSITEYFTETFSIPFAFTGKYFIHIKTDALDEVYEGFYEGDNVGTSDSIHVNLAPPSDLVVQSVTTPNTAFSGTTKTMAFTVANQGADTTNVSSWTDLVYISKKATFNKDSAIQVASSVHYGALANNNASYTVNNVEMNLPRGIQGDYYVYVHTDANGNVHEYTYNNNNVKRSLNPIMIQLSPYPDLKISSIVTSKAQWHQDSTINVDITFKNAGTGIFQGDFSYNVELRDTTLSWASQHFGTFGFSGTIGIGASISKTISLKSNVSTNGLGKLYIAADYWNQVYEYNFENNNAQSSNVLTLTPKPAIPTPYNDLRIIQGAVTSVANSGQNVNFAWTTKCFGPYPSRIYNEEFYLSSDTILHPSDIHLTSIYPDRLMLKDSSSLNHISFRLPNGIYGNQYIIVKSNATHDTDFDNNIKAIPINIALSPSVDLSAKNIIVPAEIYAGQAIKVKYTLENNGNAPTNVATSTGFYLSWAQNQLVNGMLALGYQSQQTTIAANGGFLQDSVIVTIPSYASGNYYLNVSADNNNNIYEHNGENNNVSGVLVNVLPTTQIDANLVVLAINQPLTAFLGDTVTVSVTVKNVGTDLTTGNLRNIIIHSKDTLYSPSKDLILAVKDFFVTLQPNEIRTFTLTGIAKDATGDFHSIAKINALNQVAEKNHADNERSNAVKTNIEARDLTLGVWQSSTLKVGNYRYFRVAVDSLKDLRITLEQTNSTSMSGTNKMYVAFNRPPNTTSYDAASLNAATNQVTLVPQTQRGFYYILLQTNTYYANLQQIRIKADELPFSILSVSPHTVGQGIVTTTIEGASFRNHATNAAQRTKIELYKNGNAVATGSIAAFQSSVRMDILWDLTNIAVGVYDVVLTNPNGAIVTKADGLTVEKASKMEVGIVQAIPDAMRKGRSAYWTVFFRNISNVDIPFAKTNILFPFYFDTYDIEVSAKAVTLSELSSHSPDWIGLEDAKSIPLIIKDLKPNEEIVLKFRAKSDVSEQISINVVTAAFSKTDFVHNETYAIEQRRQSIFDDISSYANNPDLVALAYNKEAFRDSMLASIYVKSSLLTWTEIQQGLAQNCINCNTKYDYNPGAAVGQELFNKNIVFEGSKTYNWEINVPFGIAGQNQGWDLVKTTANIDISATSANKFKILIESLNPCTNEEDVLTTWEAWHDYRWAIAYAEGGITGFDSTKFELIHAQFSSRNNLYGGSFKIEKSGDTLFLVFKHRARLAGEDGINGGNGLCGYRGGHGGIAGIGGNGGHGGHGGNGYLLALNGGNGGNGGSGLVGGHAGNGGNGFDTGSGGAAGSGGIGTNSNGNDGVKGSNGENSTGLGNRNTQLCSIKKTICKEEWTKLICGVSKGCALIACSPPSLATGVGAFLCAICWTVNLFCTVKTVICTTIAVLVPCDPNDIRGPKGKSTPRHIPAKSAMSYTINCENSDSLASASAQRVTIRQPLHRNVNPLSFRLGRFGFANREYLVPANSSSYTTTLNRRDDLGVDVEVTAGLDVIKNEIFWIFQSIDPVTGLAPYDPTKGLLPINDATGVGQGFVTYEVFPKANVVTGDTITAQAAIVFDINAPVMTNTWLNTIDAFAPTSHAIAFPTATTDSLSFNVKWKGKDDTKGIGVEYYSIYVSDNGKPFELWLGEARDTFARFTGKDGHTYQFFSIATDSVGNQEVLKTVGENTIKVKPKITIIRPLRFAKACVGSNLAIQWTTAPDVPNVNITVNNKQKQLVYNVVNLPTGTYNWLIPSNLMNINDTFYVVLSDPLARYESRIDTITIHSLPTANAGVNQTICPNSSYTLQGSSDNMSNSFAWSPSTGLSNATIVNPTLTQLSQARTYTLTVTNSSGCTAISAVTIGIKTVGVPNFTYVINNQTVSFQSTSSNASNLQWDFGDSQTNTQNVANPTHTYSSNGNYTVKLSMTDSCGGVSTKFDTIKLNSNSFIKLNAKVFLQGPYNNITGLMNNDLQAAGLVPLIEPYTTLQNFTHMNGGGGEITSSTVMNNNQTPTVVDWVFVELRTNTTPTTVLATRAALLLQNGNIVDIDGINPVRFSNIGQGNYHIAIRHRNHLGFRSANPISLSSIATNVDFTNNTIPVFGLSGLTTIATGKRGMNGGDANTDASIDSIDSALWEIDNGKFDEYLNTDYNLDGSVDSIDSAIWEVNNGKYEELD